MTIVETYQGSDDGFSSVYSNEWRGQTFTLGTTSTNGDYDLGEISIKIEKEGSPNDLNIAIYALDVNDFPTGTALSTGTITAASITSAAYYTCSNMTAYTLLASTKYGLVLYVSGGDALNRYKLRIDNTSTAYAGGNAISSSNSGSTWADSATDDANFIINGEIHAASSSSHVVVGTGTIGTRFVDKNYPNTKGLTAGTTITGESPSLEEVAW